MYKPSSLACGSDVRPMVTIDEIAVRVTKDIRHMDRIDYDPEGQRILKLLVPALREAYELAIPKDDTGNKPTSTITMEKDVAFKVSGVAGVEGKVFATANVPWMGSCDICKVPHDPREQYDHSPVPPGRR